jgi:hypothetical protein
VPVIALAAVSARLPLDDAATKWKDDAEGCRSWPHGARRGRRPKDDQLAASAANKVTRGKLLFAGLIDTQCAPDPRC